MVTYHGAIERYRDLSTDLCQFDLAKGGNAISRCSSLQTVSTRHVLDGAVLTTPQTGLNSVFARRDWA